MSARKSGSQKPKPSDIMITRWVLKQYKILDVQRKVSYGSQSPRDKSKGDPVSIVEVETPDGFEMARVPEPLLAEVRARYKSVGFADKLLPPNKINHFYFSLPDGQVDVLVLRRPPIRMMNLPEFYN